MAPRSASPTTPATASSEQRLSGTGFALLGLLAVRSWSTYELAKQVERSLAWFWPRTERKVYDEARKLVELGFAEAVSEPTGKRGRTVYSITGDGRRALERWMSMPSAPMKLESEALVRVFFADAGSLADLHATLDQMIADSEARLAELEDKLLQVDDPAYGFADRRHVNGLGLTFQIAHHRTVLDWARRARADTATWRSTSDAAGWHW